MFAFIMICLAMWMAWGLVKFTVRAGWGLLKAIGLVLTIAALPLFLVLMIGGFALRWVIPIALIIVGVKMLAKA